MRVHMMGICGTAMASLAGILQEQGHEVRGSDQNVYPPMSTQLEKLGIPLLEGYSPEHLQPRPDLVVVGNVITRNNPEAQALLESDIGYTSLPKALGEYVIQERQSLVVAGTHGKTTTTAMLTSVADQCVPGAGFLVGGIPLSQQRSFRPPQNDWFIIEGDEYDTAFFDKVPKFIHYRPKHVILTGIEFDHADIYSDISQIKEAFCQLIDLIPEEGTLVANGDDPLVRELIGRARCSVFTYGGSSSPGKQGDLDYAMGPRQNINGRNQFSVFYRGQSVGDIALKSFGLHNSMNALACFALSHQLGWKRHQILQGLAQFQGVKRRQEVLGSKGGQTIVEDFAHHPTAVRLTIEAMREQFPGQRVIAVFEPRSATSRRRVFQKDFVEALKGADVVYLSPPFDQSRIVESDRFSSEELVRDLVQMGRRAHFHPSVGSIVRQIRAESQPQDVVLVMSNGGFDNIYAKLLS